jgi:hypothetical protein
MLSKLLKHEMRACSRLLLPLYLVLVVFTILDRIIIRLNIFEGITGIIPVLITFLYVMSIIAIVIVSFVIVILRFYKNLIADEGYLMFTLPVKTRQLIDSKLIVSTLWTLISILITLASIFVVMVTPERFQHLKEAFAALMQQLQDEFGAYSALLIIEIIVLFFLVLLNAILHIYASIGIGQLVNGHKIIGSFAAFVVLYIASQVIGVLFILICDIISVRSGFSGMQSPYKTVVFALLPALMVYLLAFDIAFYQTTHILFKRKLNLE